jgi:hypothetical protein
MAQEQTIEQVAALCVLRDQSSPACRAVVAQVPGALAGTGEDDASLGKAKRAFQRRWPVRVAASAPVCAALRVPAQSCPRAQTVHLGGYVDIRIVEEEPAVWVPGSARALMVRPAHQGQLKMR